MTNELETAVLAGGCFWGMQDLIRKRPGIITTRVGYTGGDVANATYRHHEGHAEAIEIIFDPVIISYRDILAFFFQIHDPTTMDRQGNDVGTSYRSAIFYLNDEQRQVAEDVIADVNASGLWPGKVVTEVTRREHSGRPSRSIRTTSSTTPTATPVTSHGPIGSCPTAATA
jgi:peptide-methionine (S)-S-oxide reductase